MNEVFASLPMTRYREAHAAMDRSDWQGARAVLLELWSKSKSYDVAASLGQVEHALGNHVAAARYLTFAVAHLAPKERPETLGRYRAALDELEARIGRIQVSVDQEAAEVRVDGNLVGLSPVTSAIFVEPGEHTVEARSQGSVASNRIEVARGTSAIVVLSLAKPAPTPPPEVAPAPVAALPAEAPAELPEGSRSAVPLFVGGGVTLIGLGMAIGFGIASNSDEVKAEALQARLGPTGCSSGMATRSECDAAERAVLVQRRDARLSTIGIGVACVGAIATLSYLLFWPKPKPKPPTASVYPNGALTRAGATLGLHGEF